MRDAPEMQLSAKKIEQDDDPLCTGHTTAYSHMQRLCGRQEPRNSRTQEKRAQRELDNTLCTTRTTARIRPDSPGGAEQM